MVNDQKVSQEQVINTRNCLNNCLLVTLTTIVAVVGGEIRLPLNFAFLGKTTAL